MIHFAYPNVIPRESKFLGCGRYVAAFLGEAPEPHYELVELNVPNIQEIHLAALQLAPESTDSKQVIYERKDVSSQRYPGESRDLAYLLALISRSREINPPLLLPGNAVDLTLYRRRPRLPKTGEDARATLKSTVLILTPQCC